MWNLDCPCLQCSVCVSWEGPDCPRGGQNQWSQLLRLHWDIFQDSSELSFFCCCCVLDEVRCLFCASCPLRSACHRSRHHILIITTQTHFPKASPTHQSLNASGKNSFRAGIMGIPELCLMKSTSAASCRVFLS